MSDFKKQGGFRKGFGGSNARGGFRGKPSFGGSERGVRPAQMFQATCSECHKSCEVPFRPTGERPVYCRDCFASKGSRGARGQETRGGRGSFPNTGAFGPRRDFGTKKQFAPRESFPPRDDSQSIRAEVSNLSKQVSELASKLDHLTASIEAQNRASYLTAAVKKVVAKRKSASKKK